MAGPRRPGPAAKGRDEITHLQRKGRVLSLYCQGHTHAQIATAVGLERSTVTKMLPRLKKELVLDGDRTELFVYTELERLERIAEAMWPKLVSDEPGFRPDYRDVLAYVRLSEAIRKLVGADGFDHTEALWRLGDQSDDITNPQAEQFAGDLAEFIALADKLIQPPRPTMDVERPDDGDGGRASAGREKVSVPAG